MLTIVEKGKHLMRSFKSEEKNGAKKTNCQNEDKEEEENEDSEIVHENDDDRKERGTRFQKKM